MQHDAEQLPIRVLRAYDHTHVVFNQEPLINSFIDSKSFLVNAHWLYWQLLQIIVQTQGHGQRMAILKLQKRHVDKANAAEPAGCTTTNQHILHHEVCSLVGS